MLLVSRRRCICFGLVGLLALIFVRYFSKSNVDDAAVVCRVDPDIHRNLIRLAGIADDILTSQNITHFLCYGTLWGVLRREDLLPWERNFDFCIMNEDLLGRMDEGYFRRMFRLRGLEMEYSNARGVYSAWDIKSGKEKGVLNMHVFELVPEMKKLRRVGLNRLVPITADGADAFPRQLLAKPLNRVKLGHATFPAPREGAEIQKYHYKENWWKEIKPDGC